MAAVFSVYACEKSGASSGNGWQTGVVESVDESAHTISITEEGESGTLKLSYLDKSDLKHVKAGQKVNFKADDGSLNRIRRWREVKKAYVEGEAPGC